MKKLIIICLLLVGLSSMAQTGKIITTVIDTTAIADSVRILGPLYWDYNWNVTIETMTLDAADATLTIQVGNSASGPWINYSSNSVITLGADTTMAYEDTSLAWLYMRLAVAKNTAATGDFKVVMSKYKK